MNNKLKASKELSLNDCYWVVEEGFEGKFDDFMEMAKRVRTSRHKEGLRKLANFKFEKHSRYNLPPARLNRLEEQVRARAAMLLEG